MTLQFIVWVGCLCIIC